MVFLVVTAFINSMGIGLTSPVMPALIMDISGGEVAEAALWGGIALFIYAIMQFVFSPIVGALSDRYGRRPVLLFSLAAFAIDMAILGIVTTLWGFLLIRAFAGIFASTFSTTNAYIADVTPREKRGVRFALLGAAFGAGFIFGPAIGGILGKIDVRLPFYAGAGLAALNALYGYFVVRESLPVERRRAFEWSRANPVGTLLRLFRTPGVGPLLPVFFIATLSSWVYPTVWSYVAIEKFAWNEQDIGLSIAYYGVIAFISQAVVIQLLLPKISVVRAIWLALAVEIVALTGIGLAMDGWIVYAMVTLALISTLQDPAIRQELSSCVPEDAQGELQGGLSALTSVAMILAPIIYNGLFGLTGDKAGSIYLPGSPFIAAAGLSLLALIIYGWAHQRVTQQTAAKTT
ncbi:MAG: MFS transporter [Pseudomonadota bacterium]